jgi:cell division protein FtsW (lipid II flippase)
MSTHIRSPEGNGNKLAAMRVTLAYTTLRLAIFAAALGLLYVAGARGILLLAVAAVVSAIISFVLLARQREAMAGTISRRVTGFRERLDEGTKAEDAD